jgi:hypothetical protein
MRPISPARDRLAELLAAGVETAGAAFVEVSERVPAGTDAQTQEGER